MKLLVRFANGEERIVDMKKVEPEGSDFEEPYPGAEVCCTVLGGRYSATVVKCICSEVQVHVTYVYFTCLFVLGSFHVYLN